MSGGDSVARNPYTPRSEIHDPNLLAGRDGTLDEIRYNLSQAATDPPQCRNMAISGEPGIGKSSLCNCLYSISEDLGLVPLQFTLEKDDAATPARLFNRIYRKMLLVSWLGKAKSKWRDWSRPVKQVMVKIPWIPVQVSFGSDSGLEDRSRRKFERTLGSISSPIVLVLDNAHALLDDPSTLTKLHNVFSDLEEVVLVLAANEELYEETSQVNDHVWRKFEFYTISSFSAVSQTKEALRTPINSETGIEIPEKTVQEVHEITEGHPGEINLLGYYMFKQAQQSEEQDLQLTPSVLSQTLDQLERRKPSIGTSKVAKIDVLQEDELRVLVAAIEAPLMSKEGLVNYCLLRNFEEIRPTEYKSQKKNKTALVDALLQTGLLTEIGESKIQFTGGSYDQLYAKLSLYTRNRFDIPSGRAILNEDDITAHIHYELIDKAVLREISDCHSHFKPDTSPTSPLYSLTVDEPTEAEDFYSQLPRLSMQADGFEFGYEQRQTDVIEGDVDGYPRSRICIFGVNLEWCDDRYIVIVHAEKESALEEVEKRLEYVESRIEEIGFSIQWDTEFSHYHKGLDYAQDGQCRKAIEEFQTAVDINPEFSPGWFLQGIVHKEHGDYAEAEFALEKALTHRSDWVDALIAKCRVLWQQEKVDEFIRAAESVTDLLPDDSQFLYECALRLELDDPYKGLQFVERAYSTDNSLIEALVCAVACSYEDKRYEETIEYCKKVENHSKDVEGNYPAERPSRQKMIVDLYYIGALVAQGRFEEAFEEVTSFSDGLGVNLCALNYAAGIYLMKQEKWSEALDYFDSAWSSRDDRRTEGQIERSYMMCSQARENRTWSDMVFEKRETRAYSSILPSIDDRSPCDRHIHKKQAEVLLHLGECNRAIKNFDAGLSQVRPQDFDKDLIIGKAQALILKNEWEEAHKLLDENEDLLRDSVRGLYLKSVTSNEIDAKGSSTLELRKAIEIGAEQVKEMCRSEIYPDLWFGDGEGQIRYIEMKQ